MSEFNWQVQNSNINTVSGQRSSLNCTSRDCPIDFKLLLGHIKIYFKIVDTVFMNEFYFT